MVVHMCFDFAGLRGCLVLVALLGVDSAGFVCVFVLLGFVFWGFWCLVWLDFGLGAGLSLRWVWWLLIVCRWCLWVLRVGGLPVEVLRVFVGFC